MSSTFLLSGIIFLSCIFSGMGTEISVVATLFIVTISKLSVWELRKLKKVPPPPEKVELTSDHYYYLSEYYEDLNSGYFSDATVEKFLVAGVYKKDSPVYKKEEIS